MMSGKSSELPNSGTGECLDEAVDSLILCQIFDHNPINQLSFENTVMWLDSSRTILFTHLHCYGQYTDYALYNGRADVLSFQQIKALADKLLFQSLTLALNLQVWAIF